MNILTLSSIDFEKTLYHLNRHPADIAVFQVRKNFMLDRKEFICNKVQFFNPITITEKRSEMDCFLEICLSSVNYVKSGYFPLMLGISIYNSHLLEKNLFIQIAIEHSIEPKIFSGALFYNKNFEPIHLLKIQGTGMKRLISSDCKKICWKTSNDNLNECGNNVIKPDQINSEEKLKQLMFCIIGPYSNSSVIVNSLSEMGIKNFSLINTANNKSRSFIKDISCSSSRLYEDIYKVQADLNKLSFSGNVLDPKALDMIRKSDILILCENNDLARFWINLVSVFFMKPFIDITNNLNVIKQDTVNESDIKLIVPGDKCLFCFNGFHDIKTILTDMAEEFKKKSLSDTNVKNTLLNQLTQVEINQVVKLLKQFLNGDLKNSTWIHILAGLNETSVININNTQKTRFCPFCQF